MNTELLHKIEELSQNQNLPSYDYLYSLADSAASLLESELTSYRANGKNDKAGGLLDFTCEEKLPLVIVPDLHARSYFVRNFLKFRLPADFVEGKNGSISVFEALEAKKIRVVCVGDLLHSELRGRERWLLAEEEFSRRNYAGKAMSEEMSEGLNLLSQIMELKCAFPSNFHVLKGNHENILNETGMGNYAFRKFCNEGEMCKVFMETVYGEEVSYVISCFEKSLPLLAAFENCIISHAEPLKPYSRKEIVDGLTKADVIKGLTWTENGAAMSGSVEALLATFTDLKQFASSRYFAGHRPVRGKYALRQNGYFVQFHNPEEQNVVLVYKDKKFNPDTDIVSVV